LNRFKCRHKTGGAFHTVITLTAARLVLQAVQTQASAKEISSGTLNKLKQSAKGAVSSSSSGPGLHEGSFGCKKEEQKISHFLFWKGDLPAITVSASFAMDSADSESQMTAKQREERSKLL
jgi:hypothetical protein